MAVAAALRLVRLGRGSFWYDEVVTIRLARTANPSALLRLMSEIDASRAPLHPLILQGWVRLFGPSEFSARLLSALAGVLTVGAVYALGRRLFDRRTALLASWLVAISPLLVIYSRETRMYALLVLLTTVGWLLLRKARDEGGLGDWSALAVVLVAMIACHPLALLMLPAMGMAVLLDVRGFRARWRGWLGVLVVLVVAVGPWIGRFFDHEPEYVVGREFLKLKYLIGMPIAFTGGNSIVLAGCLGLIGFGMIGRRWREFLARPFLPRSGGEGVDRSASLLLLLWLATAPLLLFGYASLRQPIFGPSRYTIFTAPAYLILLAAGLARLSKWPRWGLVSGLSALMIVTSVRDALETHPKADWRGASAWLRPGETVLVLPSEGVRNLEAITASYYLSPNVSVLDRLSQVADRADAPGVPDRVWAATGLRNGRREHPFPERIGAYRPSTRFVSFPGLDLREYRLDRASAP